MKQHKVDSVMEAVCNQALGFIVAMMTYIFIINPLFDLRSDATESFWITSIFTVISIIRSYVVRRVFNGKAIYTSFRDRRNGHG